VAQNSDELRATGGFISGIGVVTLQNGELVDLSFKDSYAVEDWSEPHPDPPEALRKYMLADLWATRDANWWPDYPTSAKAIQRLYELNQGVSTDGVISVDMRALEMLVEALEPLVLGDGEEKITAANIREKIYEFWAPPPIEGPLPSDYREWSPEVKRWWAKRKDFMPVLTSAMLERAQNPGDLDLGKLANALRRGLEEKHILLYFDDPRLQQILAANGWDGTVASWGADYLMVVDSNMGFNKANGKIRESISYIVDLQDRSRPLAEVRLSYRHLSDAHLEECNKEAHYEPSYEALMDLCYCDYVRVYAPEGSTLIEIEGAGEYEQATGESGKAVFAAYFELAPGQEHQITFRYLLPEGTLAEDSLGTTYYRLLVQKQPGTLAIPLDIKIGLYPGTVLVAGQPEPDESASDWLRYTTRLRVDRSFQIEIDLPG
jgi:hypothetical protein